MELLGHCVDVYLSVSKIAKQFSEVILTNPTHFSNICVSSCSIFSTFCISSIYGLGHPSRCEMAAHYDFRVHFSKTVMCLLNSTYLLFKQSVHLPTFTALFPFFLCMFRK